MLTTANEVIETIKKIQLDETRKIQINEEIKRIEEDFNSKLKDNLKNDPENPPQYSGMLNGDLTLADINVFKHLKCGDEIRVHFLNSGYYIRRFMAGDRYYDPAYHWYGVYINKLGNR